MRKGKKNAASREKKVGKNKTDHARPPPWENQRRMFRQNRSRRERTRETVARMHVHQLKPIDTNQTRKTCAISTRKRGALSSCEVNPGATV